MTTIVGQLTIREDYDVKRTGETACNYTITRVKAGKYPVELHWNHGKKVLVARPNAFLLESYYVNRVLDVTSSEHKKWEDGERETSHQWRWGDHNRCIAPPTDVCGMHKIVFDPGWKVTADVRGNYAHGGPIIFYDIDEREAS